jgi:signal transduction histidine kinase
MNSMQQDSGRIALLATVAHELRNPLAAIQCAVRVLEAPNQAAATLHDARAVIRRQVLRIARISDDLLSATSASLGKLELRIERVDVREVLHAAIEACRPQLDAGHHTLMLRLPAEAMEIAVDPLRMTQVFTNLLDNAVKYSDRCGAIVINVAAAPSEVTIRIIDRGIGIAAEFLPRVFDLFVQADEARARSYSGLGLGLNLVKRIVELHRGTVIASSPGVELGSTFTVRLPRDT